MATHPTRNWKLFRPGRVLVLALLAFVEREHVDQDCDVVHTCLSMKFTRHALMLCQLSISFFSLVSEYQAFQTMEAEAACSGLLAGFSADLELWGAEAETHTL